MNLLPTILLAIPRYETYGMTGHYVMPTGILYVSSYMKMTNRINVVTCNLNHETGTEYDVLKSFIESNDIRIFGIGGLSGEYRDIVRIVNIVKQINSSISVIIGGGIVTADPETTMSAIPNADYGVVGEGEVTMVELVEAIHYGTNKSEINGIIYRSNDKTIITPPRKEIRNLDALPIPDYEGFKYDDYLAQNPDLSDEGKKYSQVSVIGGRSCKYNCTFCFHPSGSLYRQRSLDSIFHEIDYLVSHYKISYIALREELFATDNRRVAEFCRRIEPYDIDWSIQLRIDNINEELVSLLKGTRCRYIFVGVESASDEVLKSMHKGITLSQIERALSMLNDAGLNSRSGVIFGDSAETYETAMFTLNWYRSNCKRFRMFVDMIISFPGSILYKRATSAGIIPDKVKFLQDNCPIVNVSKMTKEEFGNIVHEVEKINYRKYDVKYY